jgi:hypothetical protein
VTLSSISHVTPVLKNRSPIGSFTHKAAHTAACPAFWTILAFIIEAEQCPVTARDKPHDRDRSDIDTAHIDIELIDTALVDIGHIDSVHVDPCTAQLLHRFYCIRMKF